MVYAYYEHLVVPPDFRIACELFGIAVPDFLQLLCNNFTLLYTFVESEEECATATISMVQIQDEIDKKHGNSNPYPFMKKNREAKLYLATAISIARDSTYSFAYRRDAIRPHVQALHDIYTEGMKIKPYVYYDEETKIDFPIDLVLQCAMRCQSVVVLLNAYMQKVSLAEYYARLHLNMIKPNPMMAFYLFVQGGYGGLVPQEHINSLAFAYFLSDVQRLESRYAIYPELALRIERYRVRLAYHHRNITNQN